MRGHFYHMRRSSLGKGRVRPGFSDPAAPVCFLSSALGLYVPSILRFFLMTHSSSSSVKLSRDSAVETNADTTGAVNTCIAMVTGSWGGNQTHRSEYVELTTCMSKSLRCIVCFHSFHKEQCPLELNQLKVEP